MTHKREVITGQRLLDARQYATQVLVDCISSIDRGDYGFADHVTYSQQQVERRRLEQEIEAILEGSRDSNFTVWQRMNYFLTGESVPLLP